MTHCGSRAVTDAVAAHIGAFAPATAADIEDFLAGIPLALSAFTDALGHQSDSLRKHPVHELVCALLAELSIQQAGVADLATLLPLLFVRLHQADRLRIEYPRPGEHEWNCPVTA